MFQQKILFSFFISLLIFMSFSCDKDNPVDGIGGGFLAKPGPILFISNKTGTDQLYSMNKDGGDVKQLTNDPNFPIINAKWSPDGSKIALVSPVGGVPRYGGVFILFMLMVPANIY